MIQSFEQDLLFAPNAFDWLGPTAIEPLTEWLVAHGRSVPEDLVTLWAHTGGGEMFETEEILAPGASGDHDLEAINRRLWASGLQEEFLVFHSGLYLTAIDSSERVVRIDADHLTPIGFLDSISDWYADLRGEYARKYGLPDALT